MEKPLPLTLEENKELAVDLKKIIDIAEIISAIFGSDRLRATAGRMHNHASSAMSLSVIFGPAGIDKAYAIKDTNELFDAMIDIVEAREKQKKRAWDRANKQANLQKLQQEMEKMGL